jgi:hypothetical protein
VSWASDWYKEWHRSAFQGAYSETVRDIIDSKLAFEEKLRDSMLMGLDLNGAEYERYRHGNWSTPKESKVRELPHSQHPVRLTGEFSCPPTDQKVRIPVTVVRGRDGRFIFEPHPERWMTDGHTWAMSAEEAERLMKAYEEPTIDGTPADDLAWLEEALEVTGFCVGHEVVS